MGPISVDLIIDAKVHTGEFRIEARMKEGPGGVGAGSLLLPNNERYVLGERVVVLGRLPDCDITLNDTNVSRRHAEILKDPANDRDQQGLPKWVRRR